MAKLWACSVTLEMNKAIELLCAEGKNEKFSKTVLRRHGKESQKGQERSILWRNPQEAWVVQEEKGAASMHSWLSVAVTVTYIIAKTSSATAWAAVALANMWRSDYDVELVVNFLLVVDFLVFLRKKIKPWFFNFKPDSNCNTCLLRKLEYVHTFHLLKM